MNPRARGQRSRGFTLLEVMLALTLAGLIIVAGFGALRSSITTEVRSQDADRIALLARRQMDSLMIDTMLPKGQTLEGRFPDEWTPGVEAGWRATVMPFESIAMPASAPSPGSRMLERIALEIWIRRGGNQKIERFESFRSAIVTPVDARILASGAALEALR